MKKFVLVLLAAFCAFVFAAARPAAALAQDTAAVRVNTRDDSSLFRLAFGVRRVMNGVVDQTNAAVAYASCERCRTVAISVQIVLVMGDPQVVTPTNVALAVNQGCTLCETFASAYQFVVSTGGPVRFTAEGNRALAEIRRELRALRDNSELSLEEIQARVAALMNRLRNVLATQLVPLRPGEESEGDDELVEETEGGLAKKPARARTSTTEQRETVTTTPTTTTETETAPPPTETQTETETAPTETTPTTPTETTTTTP